MNELKLSNLEKVYWPEEKYTKKDLIQYYLQVAEIILPYLRDRPVSMNRYPEGILGNHFYQKDTANLKLPHWVETIYISGVNYVLCQNIKTLIYLINLGCIELNVWSSRTSSLDKPDYLILDLDPVEIEFKEVIKVAKSIKGVLDDVGLEGFLKTSGASGLHIYIPTRARYSFDQVKQLGNLIAMIVHKKIPDISSTERLEEKRIGKVYIDYLQNNRGQTMAAPYCVRPVPGANVSTPLSWDEMSSNLIPGQFNIKNIPTRIQKKGDLFQSILSHPGFDMRKVLAKLKNYTISS